MHYEMPISPKACELFQSYDEFTRGYIECALWCGVDTGDAHEQKHDCAFDDLSQTARVALVADCEAFQDRAKHLLAKAYECDGYSASGAGHDFWLTRNGHGAGFWDRKQLPDVLGKDLSRFAHSFGSCDLFLGNDDLICVM